MLPVGSRFLSSAASRLSTGAKNVPSTGMGAPPFAIFVKENYKKPAGVSAPEALKNVSNQWKSLSEGERNEYTQKAKKIREQNIQNFEKLSDEAKENAITKSKEEKAARAKRRERKERKMMWAETNHPQRPPTGFVAYVKEQFDVAKAQGKDTSSVTKLLTQISEQWKNKSSEEKEKYNGPAKVALEKYKIEVKKWKESLKKMEIV